MLNKRITIGTEGLEMCQQLLEEIETGKYGTNP